MENTSIISKYTLIDNLDDLLELEAIEHERTKEVFSTYTYNGIQIPRVTKIIDSVMNREYLITWALGLGKYGYYNEKDFATSVGQKVHDLIEYYLQNGYKDKDVDYYRKSPRQAPVIERAYNNFKDWFEHLINTGNKFELIGLEIPVSCPYYAGTIDCICRINGVTYILDFKTSKKISYEYILQVCAYKWIIDHGFMPEYNFHIDGIGIIRVDKEICRNEDLFLNTFIPEQNHIIESFTLGFGSILSTFYQKINMEYEFNKYKKSYPGLLSTLKGYNKK